jgi:hypothetical protein
MKKNASGVSNTPKKKLGANLGILFWGANLGILPMHYDVKRRKEHVMERPGKLKYLSRGQNKNKNLL